MKLIRPDGAVIHLGSPSDQVYSMDDENGWQWHWSVNEAKRRAAERGALCIISLSDLGVTADGIRLLYPGLDEAYAMTTDLTRPLLFVPFNGGHRLIDGWHRLFRAALTGVDELPAVILTQEDADASLILRLAPGKGLDWGPTGADESGLQ